MKDWMRRLKGVNSAAIKRVEATTARVDCCPVRAGGEQTLHAGCFLPEVRQISGGGLVVDLQRSVCSEPV